MEKKKAVFVTTLPHEEALEQIREMAEYCLTHDLELKLMIEAGRNNLFSRPDQLVEDIKKQECDIVISNDSVLLLPDLMGMKNTLRKGLQEAGIEFRNTDADMEVSQLLLKIQKDISDLSLQVVQDIQGVIIYRGSQDYEDEPEFQKMKSYMVDKLGKDSTFGVFAYWKEEPEFLQAVRKVVSSDSITCVLMNRSFEMEEGKRLMRELEERNIEVLYYDEIRLDQGQQLWQYH